MLYLSKYTLQRVFYFVYNIHIYSPTYKIKYQKLVTSSNHIHTKDVKSHTKLSYHNKINHLYLIYI